MARPKGFNPALIVPRLAGAFRALGYAGASLADIEAATGLGRQSLYDTFGDKAAMYTLAVLAEVRAEEARVSRLFDGAAGGMATLRGYLTDRASRIAADRGCLLSNAAIEALPASVDKSALLALQVRVMGAIATVLSMASRRGEVRATPPVPVLARLVVSHWAGMPVRLGAGASEAELVADVEALLAVLRGR